MALIEKIKSRPFLSIAVFIGSIFILLQTIRIIGFNESDIPYLLRFLFYITLLGLILDLIYVNMKKIIKSRGGTLKKLIRDKVFLVSIGISLFLKILALIIVEYGQRGTGIERIARGFLFWSMIGYGLTIGRMIRFLGFRYNTSYPNLILLYSFIILFWSLIIYSILKIFLKLLKVVRKK